MGANTAKIPPGTGQAGTWNFNQGFHTAIDDSCQIYWNATGHSMANGKTGTYVEVYSGKRYGLGQFPTGEPPYYSKPMVRENPGPIAGPGRPGS
jgi:hypothetical protein